MKWLTTKIIENIIGAVVSLAVLASAAYLGWQAVPHETKQQLEVLASVEGIKELTDAIRDAIERANRPEEGGTT